jgi:hypothetical protein
MKNKTTGLLLSIILLATFAAIFVAVKYFARSSNGKLPLLSLNEAWSFQADDPIVSTPILIDNQIIFRTADNIYSLNTIDGKMNWEIAARASEMTINMDFIRKPIVGNSKLVISEEQENSISRPTRRARGRLDSHRQNGFFRGFGFCPFRGASLVPPAAGNASR